MCDLQAFTTLRTGLLSKFDHSTAQRARGGQHLA